MAFADFSYLDSHSNYFNDYPNDFDFDFEYQWKKYVGYKFWLRNFMHI